MRHRDHKMIVGLVLILILRVLLSFYAFTLPAHLTQNSIYIKCIKIN